MHLIRIKHFEKLNCWAYSDIFRVWKHVQVSLISNRFHQRYGKGSNVKHPIMPLWCWSFEQKLRPNMWANNSTLWLSWKKNWGEQVQMYFRQTADLEASLFVEPLKQVVCLWLNYACLFRSLGPTPKNFSTPKRSQPLLLSPRKTYIWIDGIQYLAAFIYYSWSFAHLPLQEPSRVIIKSLRWVRSGLCSQCINMLPSKRGKCWWPTSFLQAVYKVSDGIGFGSATGWLFCRNWWWGIEVFRRLCYINGKLAYSSIIL